MSLLFKELLKYMFCCLICSVLYLFVTVWSALCSMLSAKVEKNLKLRQIIKYLTALSVLWTAMGKDDCLISQNKSLIFNKVQYFSTIKILKCPLNFRIQFKFEQLCWAWCFRNRNKLARCCIQSRRSQKRIQSHDRLDP
jgi:hypothetical protein